MDVIKSTKSSAISYTVTKKGLRNMFRTTSYATFKEITLKSHEEYRSIGIWVVVLFSMGFLFFLLFLPKSVKALVLFKGPEGLKLLGSCSREEWALIKPHASNCEGALGEDW